MYFFHMEQGLTKFFFEKDQIVNTLDYVATVAVQ